MTTERRHRADMRRILRDKVETPRCDVCGRFVAFHMARHAEPGVLRHPRCDDDRAHEERLAADRRRDDARRTADLLHRVDALLGAPRDGSK